MTLRLAALALLLLVQQDPPRPDRAAELIRLLADDDIAIRDSAARDLDRMGVPALDALRKAKKASDDAEAQSRLIAVIKGIETRGGIAAKKIALEIAWPDPPPGRWDFNTGQSTFTLRVRNGNDYDVLVRPRFSLSVADAAGRPFDRYRGMWPGLVPPGCLLKLGWMDDFVTVPAEASVDVVDNLNRFSHEARGGFVGWWFDAPGAYTLTARWLFDRKAYVGHCNLACKDHDDPVAPWNRAVECGGEAKAEIRIAEGRPVACEAHLKEHGAAVVEHAAQGHLANKWCALCTPVARNFSGCQERHAKDFPEAACCYWCAGERGICAICKAVIPAAK